MRADSLKPDSSKVRAVLCMLQGTHSSTTDCLEQCRICKSAHSPTGILQAQGPLHMSLGAEVP